jgi:type IV pilus assembly protein PilA
MKKIHMSKKGFTLIEILIVIGLIAILAAIVLVAINPARQFAQARNSQRESNVNAILNAIGQDIADNKGVFGGVCSAVTLPASATNIGTGSGKIDLACLAPTYIATGIPSDPIGTAADTGYSPPRVCITSMSRTCRKAASEVCCCWSFTTLDGSVEIPCTNVPPVRVSERTCSKSCATSKPPLYSVVGWIA